MGSLLYDRIRQRNQEQWGTKRFQTAQHLGRDLHGRLADLVAELTQNAEDAVDDKIRPSTFGLRVFEKGLLAWNDGRPFSERDVEAISGLFVSHKDAAAIGYFGIGFKAVLSVTDTPLIFSGPYQFRLKYGLDPHPVSPDEPEVPSEVWRLYENLRPRGSVFWLPWRQRISPEEVRRELESAFQEAGDFLLFLERLERLEIDGKAWTAKRQPWTARACYIALRGPEEEEKQTYLRLMWEEDLPPEVLEAVLEDLEEEQKRRWREGPRKAKLGLAIRLDGKGLPQPIEDAERAAGGRLFVHLPTRVRTGLRFHLQGRFALTTDRGQIREDSPLSRWAIEALREGLRRLPEWLSEMGLLPSAFCIFPKPDEGQKPFDGLVQTLTEALREGPFFPGDDGRAYRREEVRLAHRDELYELLSSLELAEVAGQDGVCWVHPEARGGRAAEVLKALGVPRIEKGAILQWLRKKTEAAWWQERPEAWLGELYRYLQTVLSEQQAGRELENVPLIRLRDGRHVRPKEAVLPPDPGVVPEELREELDQLPIVAEALAQDFRGLLHDLGVADFELRTVLDRLLRREYGEEGRWPDAADNRAHIRLLFRLHKEERIALKDLKEWGRSLPILRDQGGRFVKPSEAYLPPELGGLPEVRVFLDMAGGRPFVTPDYREDEEDPKVWAGFLEALGVARLPRFERQEKEIERWEPGLPPSTRGWIRVEWWVDGIDEVIRRLEGRAPDVEEAAALWKVSQELHARTWEEDNPFNTPSRSNSIWLSPTRSTLAWFYGRPDHETEPAPWVRRLQEIAWLPDDQGTFRRPGELFSPNLKDVLEGAPSLSFLHPDIPCEDRKARDWAQWLGIHFDAGPSEVCDVLKVRLEADPSPESVRPIYEWLQKACEKEETRKTVARKFREEALIWVPGEGRYRSGEVCWEDPTGLVPGLRPHWEQLRRLFRDHLGVPERPEPETIAERLLGLLNRQADPDQLERAAQEAARLWERIPEELRKHLQRSRWPGQKGKEIQWMPGHVLCFPDNNRLKKLFDSIVTWWILPKEMAERLGVDRISSATPEPRLISGGQHPAAAELKRLWEAVRWMARTQGCDVPEKPPSVKRADGLQVIYQWRDFQSRPEPRRAFLSPWMNPEQEWILWAEAEADERDIGDALEEGLNITHLREFLKDLWSISGQGWDRVLEWWGKKLNAQDPYPKPPDAAKVETGSSGPVEGHGGSTQGAEGSVAPRPVAPRGKPAGPESDKPREDQASRGEGHGGMGEGERHRQLKEKLKADPSVLGKGLQLVRDEYDFPSGDRVDLLFKDETGQPVAVEVKAEILPGDFKGVWQAAKYRHIAAVCWGIACEKARGILVAPFIPEDVKQKCRELGVEPVEVDLEE
jgi:hypothetical protein